MLTIDIIIPSIRLSAEFLKALSLLQIPPDVQVSYIIIIDNPSLAIEALSAQFPPRTRIIQNQTNLGAAQSRNKGLNAATGDFVLFLDDDVAPSSNLLNEYDKAIRRDHAQKYAGFVGITTFTDPALRLLKK